MVATQGVFIAGHLRPVRRGVHHRDVKKVPLVEVQHDHRSEEGRDIRGHRPSRGDARHEHESSQNMRDQLVPDEIAAEGQTRLLVHEVGEGVGGEHGPDVVRVGEIGAAEEDAENGGAEGAQGISRADSTAQPPRALSKF